MNDFRTKYLSDFIRVAKLIALFFVYQFVFVIAGRMASYLWYRTDVWPVSYDEFMNSPTETMAACSAQGVAAGLFLSSVAMIVHLLAFKYVRIRRGFLREVKCGVLLLSALFIICMMVVFNIIAVWLGLENNIQEEVGMMLQSPVGVLSVAVVAPVLEELLFRGAVQGIFMRLFKNPWVAIVLAALLFGVIHLNPVQIFYATCLGIGFGWVYYRTGSLLPAMLGHIINNSLAVVGTLIWGTDAEIEVPADTAGEAVTVVLFTLFAFLLACLINRHQPHVPVPWRERGEL